jgi:hypothetical protein
MTSVRFLPWLLASVCALARADPGPDARYEHDTIMRLHMQENYVLLRAIERLILRGKLEDARSMAREIAGSTDEPGLRSWAVYAARVRERAARLAEARDLSEACRAHAQLTYACATCHRDAGVALAFQRPPHAPPDHTTIEARMARHRWAANRMWEAVVDGDDDAWANGLVLLARAPLREGLTSEQIRIAGQLQALAERMQRTERADTLEERALAYGEILGVCAACHEAARP